MPRSGGPAAPPTRNDAGPADRHTTATSTTRLNCFMPADDSRRCRETGCAKTENDSRHLPPSQNDNVPPNWTRVVATRQCATARFILNIAVDNPSTAPDPRSLLLL